MLFVDIANPLTAETAGEVGDDEDKENKPEGEEKVCILGFSYILMNLN